MDAEVKRGKNPLLTLRTVVLPSPRRGGGTAPRHLAVLTVLLASLAFGLALSAQQTTAAPLGLRQWAMKFLEQLGAPAVGPSAPRVQFLAQWSKVEGTFDHGNANNPLDTEMRARGANLYNAAGVKTYPSLLVGFKATIATLQQGFDRPILSALADRRSTIPALGLALAESNWTGFGQRSWNEQVYASEVSGLPVSAFRLPQPTVSIRGVVVDPLQRRVASVCVTPLRGNTALTPVLTTTNGTYFISNLARAWYRLQISDCSHVLNNAPATLYDAKATARHVSPARAQATVLSSACTLDKPCLSESINVLDVVTFGILTPEITWPRPASIPYGRRLSATQLDARASVPGVLRYSLPRGALLAPGTHVVTVAFHPRDATSFVVVQATQQVVVDRLQARLTWQRPAPIAAGTPLSAVQLDAVASVAGRFTYFPPRGTAFGPGIHPIAVRFQPADLTHYRAVTGLVRIVVLPPTLSP